MASKVRSRPARTPNQGRRPPRQEHRIRWFGGALALVVLMLGVLIAVNRVGGGDPSAEATRSPSPILASTSRAMGTTKASTKDITEYVVPTPFAAPRDVSFDPDGTVWFTEQSASVIGRLSPDGTLTEYPLKNTTAGPFAIAVAAGGTRYITEYTGDSVLRVAPNGAIGALPLPNPSAGPIGIAIDDRGDLWVAETQAGSILRLTPSGTPTEFAVHGGKAASPYRIAAGPDGAMWFTDPPRNAIGRIAADGAISEYPVPSPKADPYGITAGPDGAMWFTEQTAGAIGRITMNGKITEFPLDRATSTPSDITAANGVLLVSDTKLNRVLRVRPDGSFEGVTLPTPNSQPDGIEVAPDGAVWVAETGAGALARIEPAKLSLPR